MKVMTVKKSDTDIWKQIEQLRRQIFINEQKFPEFAVFDKLDDEVSHHVLIDNEVVVAACRTRPYGEFIKIERFLVNKDCQSKGMGTQLWNGIPQVYQDKSFLLYSQKHAVGFYEKCGFVKEGEEFEECGATHQLMKRMK